MRQRQKNDFRLFRQQLGFGFAEAELLCAGMIGEPGEYLREALPGVLAGGDGGEFSVWMGKKQPHQFLTRITGRADDGDFLGLKGGHAKNRITIKITSKRQ